MLYAFLLGLLATSSLIIGGLIASRFSLGKKTLGIIMAFGAGTLISPVSYELIFDAVKLARGNCPGLCNFNRCRIFSFQRRISSLVVIHSGFCWGGYPDGVCKLNDT